MPNTIAVNAKSDGKVTNVRILVRHPMDAGGRVDKKTGQTSEPNYVTEIDCQHDGKSVLKAEIGPRIATDPFVQFSFKGGKAGDKLLVSWVDNKGNQDSLESKVE